MGSNTALHVYTASDAERNTWINTIEGGIHATMTQSNVARLTAATAGKNGAAAATFKFASAGEKESVEKLQEIAAEMMAVIPIKSRGIFLREVKSCFIGKEAVLWMVAAGSACV